MSEVQMDSEIENEQNRVETASQISKKPGYPPSRTRGLKPFKKGEEWNGNAGGRPRKLLTEAYTAVLSQKVPGDKKGRTFAELIALGQAQAAVKGKTEPAKEIANRTEGSITETFNVNVRDVGADERIQELLRAAAARRAIALLEPGRKA